MCKPALGTKQAMAGHWALCLPDNILYLSCHSYPQSIVFIDPGKQLARSQCSAPVVHGGFLLLSLCTAQDTHGAPIRGCPGSVEQGQPSGHAADEDNFTSLFIPASLGQQLCSSWHFQQNLHLQWSRPAHFPTAGASSGLIFNYIKQKKELAVWFLLIFFF